MREVCVGSTLQVDFFVFALLWRYSYWILSHKRTKFTNSPMKLYVHKEYRDEDHHEKRDGNGKESQQIRVSLTKDVLQIRCHGCLILKSVNVVSKSFHFVWQPLNQFGHVWLNTWWCCHCCLFSLLWGRKLTQVKVSIERSKRWLGIHWRRSRETSLTNLSKWPRVAVTSKPMTRSHEADFTTDWTVSLRANPVVKVEGALVCPEIVVTLVEVSCSRQPNPFMWIIVNKDESSKEFVFFRRVNRDHGWVERLTQDLVFFGMNTREVDKEALVHELMPSLRAVSRWVFLRRDEAIACRSKNSKGWKFWYDTFELLT